MYNLKNSDNPYRTIEELLSLIEEPERSKFFRLFSSQMELFQQASGSTHNHQAWPGGYLDHIREVMNIAFKLYDTLNALRPLPFNKSDAMIALFSHDLEKPWKYEKGANGELQHRKTFPTKDVWHEFRITKLGEYGIVLTPEQENSIKYVDDGGVSDYSNKERTIGPLGAFCHACDILSARMWFDYPLNKNDPWRGAGRSLS